MECNRHPRIGDYMCISCYVDFSVSNQVFGGESIKLYKERNIRMDLTPRLKIPKTHVTIHDDFGISNGTIERKK